jgi:hypothetical protein
MTLVQAQTGQRDPRWIPKGSHYLQHGRANHNRTYFFSPKAAEIATNLLLADSGRNMFNIGFMCISKSGFTSRRQMNKCNQYPASNEVLAAQRL